MWKDHLRIEKRIVILFLVLIFTISAISNFGYGVWWTGVDVGVNYGFPFRFYGYGGGPQLKPGQKMPRYFNLSGLLVDIVVWYLFSYLLIHVYDRAAKNSRILKE